MVTCSLIALGWLFFLPCLSPHPSPTSPFSFLGITSHLLNYMYPCPSSGLLLRGPKPRPWRWLFLSSHGEKLSAIWGGMSSGKPGVPWCAPSSFSASSTCCLHHDPGFPKSLCRTSFWGPSFLVELGLCPPQMC